MRYTIIAILLFTIFSSCCEKEFVVHNRTVQRDTTIYLPSAVVRDTLSFHDSLLTERIWMDTSGRAQLRIYRDAMNRLIAECQAIPDTIRIPIERTTIITTPPKKPPDMNFFEKYGIYSFIAMIIIALIGIGTLIIKILK